MVRSYKDIHEYMFLNVSYLKVIRCYTELTAELSMVRSYKDIHEYMFLNVSYLKVI